MIENITRVAVIGMTENKGGIESVIMNIYRNMDRTKIQFDFLLPHNAGEMAYEEEVVEMGGRVFRIMYGERESFAKARQSFLQYFRENPEVKAVHLHSNYPYAFPLKMAKKAGVPVRILHAHNSAILFNNEKGIKSKIKKLRNYIVYKQVDKYPTIYFSCSDLASKSTFRDNKYVWIKNGIDLEQFKYNENIRKELRNLHNIDEEDKVLGFVGRLCERKNTLFALEIFKEYVRLNPNAKMIFAGDGEQREELEEKIAEYELRDKVIILGMISDVHKWYQVFDILLLPSLFEGFPVVLVEGQAAGLPCIVSDTVTKQVGVTDLLTYKSNNAPPEQWAKKIENILLTDRKRLEYKGKMYEEGFDVKSMVNEVVKYYMISK